MDITCYEIEPDGKESVNLEKTSQVEIKVRDKRTWNCCAWHLLASYEIENFTTEARMIL